LVKLNALVKLQRDVEAEALAAQLMQGSAEPEAVFSARVQLAASWIRRGACEKALPVLDGAINQSKVPTTLAAAWLNKGEALLATEESRGALVAFLHVPVLYSDQKLVIPAAILGSAHAYIAINDLPKASRALRELITLYPASPEASSAKRELQKLEPAQPR
jgi:tetratricopeptide (TPR) repeat protein